MSAKKKQRQHKKATTAIVESREVDTKSQGMKKRVPAADHLPPLPLVFTVLACSGSLWVLGLRDMIATGRNILGPMDDAYLAFTKGTQWFDDSKGWKSTMGGFSAVEQITTDGNNMGGLFVRKVGGAAILAVHLHKLLPLLFHPAGAQWKSGHFRPMIVVSLMADLAILAFFGTYLEDFALAGADELPNLIMIVLSVECLVFGFYLFTQRQTLRGPAIAMPEGKTPASVPSRIVMRTVGLVSSLMVLVAGRDFFFPGYIISFFPRDDIYLEWTGVFLHSPPPGTPEAIEQGLEAPLYVGEKFASQLMALHILLLCLYKFVSGFLVKLGSDGSGEIKCKMMWKASAIGSGCLVFLFRLFTPAAQSASLDLRWHLMSMGYEAFILGLLSFA